MNELRDAFNVLSLLMSMAGGALGAYVAIRVRLERIETRLNAHEQHSAERWAGANALAQSAHTRIDDILRARS